MSISSAALAPRTRRAMVEQADLFATGMAEADPAADNTTEAGKAQNRRVAVNILVSKSVDGMGSGF